MNFINLSGEATPNAASPMMTIIMLVLMVAIFYFLMIRPQKKREKQEQAMRDALQVGDEIISIGGICGRVVSIKDDSVVLESPADHSKIKLLKTAIQTNVTARDAAAEAKKK